MGETFFVFVILCCTRHPLFYDGGRLGRVEIVTLTVGARAKYGNTRNTKYGNARQKIRLRDYGSRAIWIQMCIAL